MDCSTPGFPVHHQLPELAQTHVHQVWWSHPTISSCLPLLLLPSFFPSIIDSFPVSQSFSSVGQSIEASASASVLSMNIQDWFPLGWTGLTFLQSKGCSSAFSNTTVQKHQFFGAQPSLWSNSRIHARLVKKTIALTTQIFVSKAMSLLFNMLSRLLIAFLPRGKHLIWAPGSSLACPGLQWSALVSFRLSCFYCGSLCREQIAEASLSLGTCHPGPLL